MSTRSRISMTSLPKIEKRQPRERSCSSNRKISMKSWFIEAFRRTGRNPSPVKIINYEYSLSDGEIDWIMNHFYDRELKDYKIITSGIDFNYSMKLESLLTSLSTQNKYGTKVLGESLRKLVVFVQNEFDAFTMYQLLLKLRVSELIIVFSGGVNDQLLERVKKMFGDSLSIASRTVHSGYGQYIFSYFPGGSLNDLRVWQHWHPVDRTVFNVVSYFILLFEPFMVERPRRLVDIGCQVDLEEKEPDQFDLDAEMKKYISESDYDNGIIPLDEINLETEVMLLKDAKGKRKASLEIDLETEVMFLDTSSSVVEDEMIEKKGKQKAKKNRLIFKRK